MGRVEELLYDLDDEAFDPTDERTIEERLAARAARETAQAAWEATPEDREWRRAQERERLDEERKRVEQERRRIEQERGWARKHPTEWGAWLAIQPLWGPQWAIDLCEQDEPEYGFEQFLAEVGRA